MSQRFELSAALLCFLIAPLVAGEPKEVVARWEELAPLVEKREIETVLANGVHIRGRVEKVLPEALEVRVKRTSDPAVVPKGRTRVPRELVGALTVRWRQGPARALLATGGFFGPVPLLTYWEVGGILPYVILAATTTLGYSAGRELDAKSMRIVVLLEVEPGFGSTERPVPY